MVEPMFGYIWEIPFILGMVSGVSLFVFAQYLINRYNIWKQSVRKAEMYYNGAKWKDEA